MKSQSVPLIFMSEPSIAFIESSMHLSMALSLMLLQKKNFYIEHSLLYESNFNTFTYFSGKMYHESACQMWGWIKITG